MECGKCLPLDPDAEGEQDAADSHHLPAHALAVVHLGLGGPVEELDDVLGHLRGGRGRAVFVINQAVVQHARHCDAGAREVGVEVETALHDGARRRLIRVASQEGEDVVAAAVAGLDDEAEVGRQGAIVGRACRLVILVRRGDVIGQLAGSFLDLPFIIGLCVILVLFRERLGLVDRHYVAHQAAVGDARERVARRAHLAVHLEAAAQGLVVEGAVQLFMLPWVLRGVEAGRGLSACWGERRGSLFTPSSSLTLLRPASWRE